jgi:hypothetical protein
MKFIDGCGDTSYLVMEKYRVVKILACKNTGISPQESLSA